MISLGYCIVRQSYGCTSDLFTSFSFYTENLLISEVQSSNGFLLWGSFQFKDTLYEQYDKP